MRTTNSANYAIWRRLAAVVFAACLAGAMPVRSEAADVTLTESGSTLLFPLFKIWVENYTSTHAGVSITMDPSGSETGIKKAISGEAQIGASDVFMSDRQARENPQVLNIPLCISAQMVNFNLPDLNNQKLKLDGTVLAGIYSGTIRDWDAAPIAALNPDIKLPHQPIVPVRRSDGSGDTYIFTQFLSFADSKWSDDRAFGMTINWPVVSGSLEATGNEGMVQTIQKTPYSIGYIGVSYSKEIADAGLGTALLKNQAGNFLLPTKETVEAAAEGLGTRTPSDERLTIVLAPGANAYPLINYEYAVVSTKQPNSDVAAALRKFLTWSIVPSEANEGYLDTVHFIALPAQIFAMSEAQIQNIK
ncbi:MAG: phosphate ABC transporter substrate-binding protein PstS, partial [Verrucomicrobia bacterium]|nr:phosphate ABC transporter substrate-binding protein PstS [Verrucomicrobiota bacterium]